MSNCSDHAVLKAAGLQAGLTEGFIVELFKQFGPLLTQLLIELLVKKQAEGAKLDLSGFSWVKTLLSDLLSRYQEQLITAADEAVRQAVALLLEKLKA